MNVQAYDTEVQERQFNDRNMYTAVAQTTKTALNNCDL